MPAPRAASSGSPVTSTFGRKMKSSLVIVSLLTIAFACYSFQSPTMFRLKSLSPSGGIAVRGLPYKGSRPDAMDGNLRLFIGSEKRQTDIPFSRKLHINWNKDGAFECFSILSDQSVLMTWRIEPDNLVCIYGSQHLAVTPHTTN